MSACNSCCLAETKLKEGFDATFERKPCIHAVTSKHAIFDPRNIQKELLCKAMVYTSETLRTLPQN